MTDKPGETSPKPTKAATLTVACKVPNGMILQLCKEMDHQEAILGGGMRTVKQWHPFGDKVKINGPAHPFGVMPNYRIVGGYALTEGVNEEFFNVWMKQHEHDASVVNHMIFAHSKTDYAVDWAKDHKSTLSGLQPLVMSKNNLDPRVPKSKVASVGNIESEEEQVKRRSA